MNLISGSCLGFYDLNATECLKCREKEKCKIITSNEHLKNKIGIIPKDSRKAINEILKMVDVSNEN